VVSRAWELPSVKGLSGYVIAPRARRAHTYVDGSRVAYKTTADVVSKVVTLVVTVAAARALSASDFGIFALGMTTGWLLGVASDAGLPMYLATRVAQAIAHGAGVERIVHAVMRWRWMLGATAAACGAALGIALVPGYAVLAFVLIVTHQLFGAMLDTLAHAYRGLGRTEIESSLSLAHRGAIALGALTVLAVTPSLLWLSLALAVPPLVTLAASHLIVRRLTTGCGVQRSGPTEQALDRRAFVRDVAPLGLGVLLSALYFRCDVYFIERLHGVEMLGVYNAVFRVVDALRLFPAAALAVAYPSLCGAADFRPVRRLSFGLVGASLAVMLAIYVGAYPLLALVYGDAYAAGGAVLQVLSLCLPLFYLNYALTHQLIAWDGQRKYLAITATALAVNLAGNSLLIPRGAMIGAAVSTLITELVVCGGCVVALRKR
jgi:O-antigen/teichoic acid export membrane protein